MDAITRPKFHSSDRFQKLPASQKMIIGEKIKLTDLPKYCNALNIDYTEDIEKAVNPGYSLLKLWETKELSTFRILEDLFVKFHNNDLVNQLKKFQIGEVELTLLVQIKNNKFNMSKEINLLQPTEDQPIKNLIKLLIMNHFAKKIENKKVFVTMNIDNAWDKCCRDFVGQEITITIHFPAVLRPQTSNGKRSSNLYEPLRRNALTSIDVCDIFFSNSIDDIKDLINNYDDIPYLPVFSQDYSDIDIRETEIKQPFEREQSQRKTKYLENNYTNFRDLNASNQITENFDLKLLEDIDIGTKHQSSEKVIYESNDNKSKETILKKKDEKMNKKKSKPELYMGNTYVCEESKPELSKGNTYVCEDEIEISDKAYGKKEKSTDCDSALIPLFCVHG